LGVAGGVVLALLLAGLGLAIARSRARARVSADARTAMVAATGVTVVWLVSTSGDWMHLLPGVTAMALIAIAVLCRPTAREVRDAPGVTRVLAIPAVRSIASQPGPAARTDRSSVPLASRPPRGKLPIMLGAAMAVLVLAIGGASLLRSVLVQHYLDDARAALRTDPAGAVSNADQALKLDGSNLDAYYVKAAGQARFNLAHAAQATLLQAAAQDPGNFITWTLLGDLAVRAGHLASARGYYQRALALDPREPGLRVLVANPASSTHRPAG
jgi:hypothetical protein